MTLKNIEQLKQAAEIYKVAPQNTAWFRLESKLEKERSKRKIVFYKYFSIAAASVAVLSVISFFALETYGLKTTTPTADLYQTQITELTDDSYSGIYDLSKLRELKSAYQKMGIKNKM